MELGKFSFSFCSTSFDILASRNILLQLLRKGAIDCNGWN